MDRAYRGILSYWRRISWKELLVIGILHLFLILVTFYKLPTSSSNTLVTPQLWFFLGSLLVAGTYYLKLMSAVRMLLLYGLGYLYVSIMHYFILASLNLNDPTFDVFDWSNNGLYLGHDFNYLWLLLGLLLLRWLFCRLFSFPHTPARQTIRYERIVVSYLWVWILLTSDLLRSVLKIDDQLVHSGIVTTGMNLLGLLFLGLLMAMIWYKGLEVFMTNKANFALAMASSLTLAIILHYYVQLPLAMGESLLGQLIFPGATLFQILVLWGVILSLYMLFNRYLLTTLLSIGLGILFVAVNMMKTALRNEPLLVTDLSWLKDSRTLLEFVEQQVILDTLWQVSLAIIVYLFLRKRLFKGRVIKSYGLRIVSLGILLTCLSTSGYLFRQATQKDGSLSLPVLSPLGRDYQISWLGFRTTANYKSLMYVWLEQLTTPVIEKPKKYNAQMIQDLAEKYQALANDMNKVRTENLADQTVIYLLSESLSDPVRIPGVELSQPALPHINDIQSKTTSGLMISDGYGGGTANMEFQSLTGLPLYNFSPSVSIAYTEIVPKLGYFPSISNWFSSDNRLVIHPASASNYNRNIIYKDLEFDKFIAHLNSKHKVNHLEVVGANISDRTVYRNILDEIDPSQSQFFSILTMQNHIPWSASEPSEMVVTASGLTEEEMINLTSYARLLTITDSETADFLNALSQIDKKITVVFYGDHLPGLYPNHMFETAPETQYQTDYFIWSNYQSAKLDYPLIHSSDFTALLLAHTNAKVSPYYALLTEVLELNKANSDSLTTEQQAVAEDLFLLQYDLTLGKRYLLKNDDFFALP